MYEDALFEKAVKEAKEEEFSGLQCEVKDMEGLIERFLSQLLESTTSISERDFMVCGL